MHIFFYPKLVLQRSSSGLPYAENYTNKRIAITEKNII